MQAIHERETVLALTQACAALGVPRTSYYRDTHVVPPAVPTVAVVRYVPRALIALERVAVLDVLHEERLVDLAPALIHAPLLDEETYLCSVRTMYRLLAANAEVQECRALRRHPLYAAPELLAEAPKQLWTWDITKLKGPVQWSVFQLYVLLDVFSRYVVGWLVADRESTPLAQELIATSCARRGIVPGRLTVHADRGAAMTSRSVVLRYAYLGMVQSHSSPSVSNDNPYAEAQFKTLKDRPDSPDRFGSREHARDHCANLLLWYNTEPRHSALGYHTPHDVHYGLATARQTQRAVVLSTAFTAHPERFVRGAPTPAPLPSAAWINPPKLLTLLDAVTR